MLIPGEAPRMKGFTSVLPKCEACKAYKYCHSPKIPVTGKGKKGILVVGEVPSKYDDKRGRAFSGESGKLLADEFTRNGLNLRSDCWLTTAVICKTAATPTSNQVEWCRPNLIGTIRKLQPRVIILLGSTSVQSLIPYIWKGTNVGGIERWAGFRIPCRPLDAWVCPTHAPSSLLRSEKDPMSRAMLGQFGRHIKAAVSLRGRPYEGKPPSEGVEVEVIIDPIEAAAIITDEMRKGGLSSFDYETTMLKPDGPAAKIVSCAICFRGERTIAYPWHGDAIKATKKYLRSDLPKAGANIKFEQRWTMAQLGVKVKNWVWDSMQAAHVLDHRQAISSVKFQAFVRFGTPIWDDSVRRFLTSDGPSVPNRIRQCDLQSLLHYNAIDALVEWRLAIDQSRQFGITLPGVE